MGVVGADGAGIPFGPRMVERYPNLVPQGISAELIAEKWGITREELDAFAVESQQRAAPRHRARAASTARSCR